MGFVSGDEELNSIFWPWQVRLIVEIWQRREMTAKAAYEFLIKDKALSSGLSRASVMTFLEGLASDEILSLRRGYRQRGMDQGLQAGHELGPAYKALDIA